MIVGRTTRGVTPITLAADTKIVTRIVLPVAGRLPKLTLLLDGQGSGATGATQQLARGVVYGSNDQLVAQGEELVIAAGRAKGWVDFGFRNISGGVVLAAGTYDLGVHAGPASNVIRVYV